MAQNPRRPVGRTRNHGRADLLLSWGCRARPYRPAPCARYRSPVPLVRFCRGVALRPAVAGARAGFPGLCGIVRAAPTLPACGLVGCARGLSGRAGWSLARLVCQPAVVRAGVRPLACRGVCARCRVCASRGRVRPARFIKICRSAGMPPGGPCPAPPRLWRGHPLCAGGWFRRARLGRPRPDGAARPPGRGGGLCRVGWGWWSLGGRAPRVRLPPDGTPPRQVWRVCARMQGAARPRGACPPWSACAFGGAPVVVLDCLRRCKSPPL